MKFLCFLSAFLIVLGSHQLSSAGRCRCNLGTITVLSDAAGDTQTISNFECDVLTPGDLPQSYDAAQKICGPACRGEWSGKWTNNVQGITFCQ
jgi:hypothetical protein